MTRISYTVYDIRYMAYGLSIYLQNLKRMAHFCHLQCLEQEQIYQMDKRHCRIQNTHWHIYFHMDILRYNQLLPEDKNLYSLYQ